MKTKIKRHSRSVISVILAVCMLVSCMTVGIIATDAANVDSETVGTTYYMLCSYNKQNPGEWSSSNYATATDSYTFSLSPSNFGRESWQTGINYYVGLSSSTSVGDMYCQSGTATCTKSGNVNGAYPQQFGNYRFAMFSLSTTNVSTVNVTVSVSGSTAAYAFSTTAGSGGTGSSTTAWHSGWQTNNTTATIYYDNSITQWTSVKFRIGRDWNYNSPYHAKGSSTYAMTKVTGTDNIYKYTFSSWSYYNDFYFVNGGTEEETDGVGIQTIANRGFTAFTTPMNFDLGSSTYFFIGQSSSVGTTASPTEVLCYGASGGSGATTATDYTTYRKSITNTSVSNGTVVVNWTNPSGVAQTIAEGATTANVLIGTTLSVTMTPATTNYVSGGATVTYAGNANSVTISGAQTTFTSGNNNTTVTGSFPEVTHEVTFSAGTGGTIDPSGTQDVGVLTTQSVTATPATGYQFFNWTLGTGIATTGTLTTNPLPITTSGAGDVYTVHANFTKQSYTLTKGSETNGTFTVTYGESTITETGSVLFDETITVACTPATGYIVSTVTAGANSGTEGENNVWTVKMPASAATLNVTFAKKDNAITTSASPVGGGTVWVATSNSSNTALTNFQVGDTVYLRANPAAAYNFSKFVVTYANGDTAEVTTNDSSITIPAAKFDTTTNDGSISVVGYFTLKTTYNVSAVSSNRALGSVVASTAAAYEGQTVTVEYDDHTGDYASYTVKDSSNETVASSKSGKKITFTMPASAVTVTVNFNTHSGTSNFYYNSYGSNGQPASTHYGARMTEAKLGGETYSFYHVTGRSESDQLFTVSYESPVYDSYDCFFEIKNGWESSGVSALFYASDGKNLGGWSNMTHVANQSDTKKFKIAIPDGARSVRFKNNAGNQDETDELYFTSGNNGWMHNGSTFKDVAGYNQSNPVETNFWENFNSSKYTNAFSSGGFNNHNANRGESHSYTKPDNLSEAQRSDYYIIVLYENKTYTINGVTKKVTNNPEIIWLPSLPTSTNYVSTEVYAKDGAIRNHDSYGPYTTLAKIADTALSPTVIRDGSGVTVAVTDHSYQAVNTTAGESANDQDYQTATVESEDVIHVTTTINEDNRARYYVKGFIVNGETVVTFQWNSTGVYELDYTVTGEERNHKVEITPVYFLKDDTNTINFAIDGFEPDLQFSGSTPKWGDTIYVYPFYSYNGNFITGRVNAFGSYPGQPMVFDGGKYYIQIPKTIPYTPSGSSTAVTATVSGVTMSNGYWDHVHRSIMGWPEDNKNHHQTYDYDDFYKIANELSPDNITFEFKYRTEKQNKTISTSDTYSSFDTTTTFKNGFDDLKDIYGRPIDIFGNLLTADEQDYSPVYVVSKGYQVTNAGSYATEWEIFYPNAETGATSWTKATSGTVSAINPSALTLSSASGFATYSDSKFSKYSGLYDALDKNANVKRQPVKITFESEILNTDGDKAERSDGQWFHSNNNDIISANIEIEYKAANGTWTADTFSPDSTSTITGVTTGGKAYFTNTEKNIAGASYYGTRATGNVYSNNKEYFTFTAQSSADYKFVGWYRKVTTSKGTNYYAITGTAQSPKTTNDTYVARFVPYTGGRLTVNNTLKTDGSYTGNGTTQVKLDIISSNDLSAPSLVSTDFQNGSASFGSDYIVENSTRYVRVTLKTIPSGIDTFEQFSYKNGDTVSTAAVATFFPDGGTTAGTGYTLDGTTAVKTFIIKITDLFGEVSGEVTQTKNLLDYYSELNKWTLNYELKYYFSGREFGNGTDSQWYVAKGEFEGTEYNNNVTQDGANYYISRDFLSNKRPYERDFMKSITWNFDAACAIAAKASNPDGTSVITDNVNHKITYQWEIHQNTDDAENTARTGIFMLPYCYNPNNGYEYDRYVPVVKYVQKTGTTSGTKYYEASGYFYTPEDEGWNDYLTLVASWQNKNSGSAYDSAYASTNCPYGYVSEGVPKDPTFETAMHGNIPCYDLNESIPTFEIGTVYGKRFVLNETYPDDNASEENYRYITAVSALYDSSEDGKEGSVFTNGIRYFSYWKITNNKGVEIAKCYANNFNFSAYDNYQIQAVYDGTAPGASHAAGYSEAPGATISYLDDSRNQWNEGGGGTNVTYKEAGDVLFKDFAVAYTYNSEVFNTYTDKRIRVGVAIEWVKDGINGALINDIDGTNMKNYEEKYSSTEATAIANVKSRLSGSSTPNNIYIKPIASNIAAIDEIATDSGYQPLSDRTIIDNKNRLKYHYAVYNTASDGTNEYDNIEKYGVRLYRAYAYIMIDLNNDGDFADVGEIVVSAKPAYFTFNDVANRKSDK